MSDTGRGIPEQLLAFKGKKLPSRAFINETLVKRDGKWVERFFQVTTLER